MHKTEYKKRMRRLDIIAKRVMQEIDAGRVEEARRLAVEAGFARQWRSLWNETLDKYFGISPYKQAATRE